MILAVLIQYRRVTDTHTETHDYGIVHRANIASRGDKNCCLLVTGFRGYYHVTTVDNKTISAKDRVKAVNIKAKVKVMDINAADHTEFSNVVGAMLFAGGLFDDTEDATVESAFRYALLRINQDRTLLPDTRIVYDIQHLPAQNSFIAAKKGARTTTANYLENVYCL